MRYVKRRGCGMSLLRPVGARIGHRGAEMILSSLAAPAAAATGGRWRPAPASAAGGFPPAGAAHPWRRIPAALAAPNRRRH